MLDIPSFMEATIEIEDNKNKSNTDHVKRPLMVDEILKMDLSHEGNKRGGRVEHDKDRR